MTWRQRYLYRLFLRSSLWVVPTVGLVLALSTFRLIGVIGRYMEWHSATSPDAARTVVGMLTSAMLTLLVFIMSAILVAVQLASAQLSSRIIALALQDTATRACLGICVFAFTFSLALLSRIESYAPMVEMQVSIWSSLVCVCAFLYLVNRMAKSFRPVTVLTGVASSGAEVIRHVYPHLLDAAPTPTPVVVQPSLPAQIVRHSGSSSVFLAFHAAGLVEWARKADAVIEIVPQVGDFVVHDDPVFRVYAKSPVAPKELLEGLAFGAERTMDQDPAFAFRIIVDIASKALSPAINDPTTAVLALDQLHMLLRLVGLRQLDTGRIDDAEGQMRLLFRTPDWEDFVALGLSEIRQFGATSLQVARRMRALLMHLLQTVPPERHPPLQEQLELLQRSVERHFPDPEDRAQACAQDLQGLGGSAGSWTRVSSGP
jgi:uncharacterized membrane protein